MGRSRYLPFLLITLLAASHSAVAFVWWDPWTWIEKGWKPISDLSPSEVRKEGKFTVAQYNYRINYAPAGVVKFVGVVNGKYRDIDDERREFVMLTRGIGSDGKEHSYESQVFRVVPAAKTDLAGTVSDEYAYVVVKFQKKS